jgi:hypothetical protein
LFLPAKVGNLDCTFCLDCVQACPHDNVAVATRVPGAELLNGSRRSGIGRLGDRPDLAALAVLFAFGALVNALAMTSPVYALEESIGRVMRVSSELPVLVVVFAAVLGIIPSVLLTGAATVSRLLTKSTDQPLSLEVVNYAFALLPFGFGVWLAHYTFHLLTGLMTIVPVAQSAAVDLFGRAVLGEPLWRWGGLRPGAVFPVQIGFVLLGTLGSIAVAYGISEREHADRPLLAAVPWAIVLLAMTATALWILSSPMEMRAIGATG